MYVLTIWAGVIVETSLMKSVPVIFVLLFVTSSMSQTVISFPFASVTAAVDPSVNDDGMNAE